MCDLAFKGWEYSVLQASGKNNPEMNIIDNKYIVENVNDYFSSSVYAGKYDLKKDSGFVSVSVDCREEYEKGKVIIALFQYKDDKQICGDYLIKKNNERYENSLKIMDGVNKLKIEYLFYSYGKGRAEFSAPVIKTIPSVSPRYLNVATAYFERKFCRDIDANVETILNLIEQASMNNPKPDILCFTETTYDRGVEIPTSEKFIAENSRVLKLVKEKAKKTGMYIVFGFHERGENGDLYNTAVIISDKGEIVAKYRKTHLCYDEIKCGMIPGNDIPVFDLPIGKIGVLICWDQWFPESARELVYKGAEVIIIATAGFPKCITQARARENGVYVVAAGAESEESSFICDKRGKIIAKTDSENQIAYSTLNLNSHEYIKWLSFNNGYGADLYKCDIRKDLYTYNKINR